MADQTDKKNQEAEISELEKLAQEREEYLNGWRRAVADFENYKRDESKRLQEGSSYVRRSILKDIFPVLDSLDRAINTHSKNESVSGLELVKNQFLKVLEDNGVKKIEVNVGDDFDHNLHSALSEAPVEDEALVGKIVEVVGAGYELDGRVVRAAKVVIGRMKKEE
ncbi:MAG: nucleotide exchange factor GrpE [Candidatus Harrisonbacteria bacterium CG10_big_fil_rev_8_21_14_0_10_45_28]|uniref:Protein GrpE n=1 Tax=Candidatus Harrisonbacteria bacterium CG10_big_fil_rev_8_21_14_0_10_45_28 TaxID=1974586 RepID=A0A2H0UQQ3_9BACT|nr:MAG: nucleotide exchange factor GrpE [Candidatus Harrisonbacteria bacterium CG10_big_fil_rev_8_21_14_0_10_45_28]